MTRVPGYLGLRQCLSDSRIVRWLLATDPFGIVRELDRVLVRAYPPDVRLRHEFNRWAKRGMGESMEADHLWFAEKTLQKMTLSSGDCILDLGCGEGWASRLMAAFLDNGGQVVAIDVSDEMLFRARTKSKQFENLEVLCGSAEHLPCRDSVFTKVLSISAFPYFEHQEAVLKELCRVVMPEGQLFLLTALYKDLPDWSASARALTVPVQVRSADEYKSLLRDAGWIDVEVEELLRECQPGAKAGGHRQVLLVKARRPPLSRSTLNCASSAIETVSMTNDLARRV